MTAKSRVRTVTVFVYNAGIPENYRVENIPGLGYEIAGPGALRIFGEHKREIAHHAAGMWTHFRVEWEDFEEYEPEPVQHAVVEEPAFGVLPVEYQPPVTVGKVVPATTQIISPPPSEQQTEIIPKVPVSEIHDGYTGAVLPIFRPQDGPTPEMDAYSQQLTDAWHAEQNDAWHAEQNAEALEILKARLEKNSDFVIVDPDDDSTGDAGLDTLIGHMGFATPHIPGTTSYRVNVLPPRPHRQNREQVASPQGSGFFDTVLKEEPPRFQGQEMQRGRATGRSKPKRNRGGRFLRSPK